MSLRCHVGICAVCVALPAVPALPEACAFSGALRVWLLTTAASH